MSAPSSTWATTGGGPIVGVNLCWLVPGVVGGSEEYTVRLLEAVGSTLGPEIRLRLYGRPDLAQAHPRLVSTAEFVACPVWPGGRAGRVALENSWLARQTRHDDVVHHAGGTLPFVRPAVTTLVTIHDLQPLDQPANFGLVKRRWLGRALPAVARKADLILCPSHHTANRVAELLDVPEERLRVVPHGLALGERGPAPAGEAGKGPSLADMLPPGVRPGRFLLYPAIAYPHKRHIDLIRLLERLSSRFDDVALVLTGRPGPEDRALADEAERLGVAGRVHRLGRVPWSVLETLYRGAGALVFPSAYEGFGNPAVEAMALGCPVVASSAGALPEVVGSAGVVVPVGDVEAMADAVAGILDDPATAEDLRRRGRRRAQDFEVDIAAQRLGEVYREVVDTARI